MIRVLTESEYEKHKGVSFGEQWVVLFLYKNPVTGFWERRSEMYYTVSKNRSQQVGAKWRKVHKGEDAVIVNILYQ